MRVLVIIFCVSTFSHLVTGQTDPESILEIREHFNYVNDNLSKFQSRSFENIESSTEGGNATLFFDNEFLVKVSVELFGETGKLLRDYYLKNGKLVFVFDQHHRYNMPIYIDEKRAKEYGLDEGFDPGKTRILEDRFYFDNNKMIRWIDQEKNHRSQDETEYSKNEKYYLELGKKYKEK